MDKDNMSIMFPDLQELMDEIKDRMDGEAKGEIVYEWNEERLAEVNKAFKALRELCPEAKAEIKSRPAFRDSMAVWLVAEKIQIRDVAKLRAALCDASIINAIPKTDGTLYFILDFYDVATPYRKK